MELCSAVGETDREWGDLEADDKVSGGLEECCFRIDATISSFLLAFDIATLSLRVRWRSRWVGEISCEEEIETETDWGDVSRKGVREDSRIRLPKEGATERVGEG